MAVGLVSVSDVGKTYVKSLYNPLSLLKILSEQKSDRHKNQERPATMNRRTAAYTISSDRVSRSKRNQYEDSQT